MPRAIGHPGRYRLTRTAPTYQPVTNTGTDTSDRRDVSAVTAPRLAEASVPTMRVVPLFHIGEVDLDPVGL